MPDRSFSQHPRNWFLSLTGLGLFVFALVALSGPGRIDIVDGQTRFEVGRSLFEHGDSILRDDRIWWGIFPGRDGEAYTYYRIPQCLVAAASLFFTDATGSATEGRRHFIFVLSGAVACGLLSIVYACWFRHLGCRPASAILWALGGIVCTPCWFYGTSTFDDILGTTVLVSAVTAAYLSRYCYSIGGAILAGLLMGLAYHCKQPLGAFVLVVLAAHDQPHSTRRERLARGGLIIAGLFLGMVTEKWYDWYKYPFDKFVAHKDLLEKYVPIWSGNPLPALLALTISPGAGVPWFCPPVFIMFAGLVAWRRSGEARIVRAVLIGAGVFIGFISMLSFFKGDPAWGPRYLTPVFALLWLFAPAGAALLRRSFVVVLLGFGVLVQVLALTVDHHRLYVQKALPSGLSAVEPWMYFYPIVNHLLNRPREIVEIATNTDPAEEFSPAPAPTFAFPVIDPPYLPETGPEAVRRYHVLNSFRPWWMSQQYLSAGQRPVDIATTASGLGTLALFGLTLMVLGTRSRSIQGG